MSTVFEEAERAAAALLPLGGNERSELLLKLSGKLLERQSEMLDANALDLLQMDKSNPLYDRLLLTPQRIASIASDMAKVSSLDDPLGRILEERVLPNGLELKKIAVPYGVIGVVFEARPNVIFDVFSLCFKSGNACILKGGKDASNSNLKALEIIRDCLRENSYPESFVTLLPSTHEATLELLQAVGYVDLVIPRGGRRLIDFVRFNAKVPVIETGAGVVHSYFDLDGDTEIGRITVNNAKTRRVSVCNALDCLVVHEGRLADLPELCALLKDSDVVVYADEKAYAALDGKYPAKLLQHAVDESFGTEYMDYKMAVKTVSSLEEAIAHINRYGSGHSESIITDNEVSAAVFQRDVDAGCVYVNAPTSFTDGAQFGLGAEIGISTQKLGARGPMGLRELTTMKWLIRGKGQTRPK